MRRDNVARVIRRTHVGATLLIASACNHGQPPPRADAFRAPPLHLPAQHEPLRGYRLAESFVAKGPFRDGAPLRVGAIVNGLRVRPDASGLRFAESVAVPALQAGVPLPEAWGGGILFWNDTALYTAESFLGTLTPLLEIGFHPVRVSFGPSFALLRGSDGDRLAIDVRTRQRVAITPPLLADIAATAEGRALALLEAGACLLSEDAGKSFRPLPLPVGTHALSVREASGQLLAGLSSGQQVRVDSAGKVQLEAMPKLASLRPAADSLWPVAEPPLERALLAGVPIGLEFAGVAVAGSVATVNLRTGELVQVTRALVPSELSCRTLDGNGALLLACHSKTNGSLLLSDVFGERPLTQAKFPPGVAFDFAEGVLVASARCDGLVRPGAVCVRGADGRFHDFDVSARLAKLEQAAPQPKPGADPAITAPSILHWVPKVGGGAVAVIGGAAPGLLDAQTGAFVPISPDVSRGLLGSQKGWLGLDWVAFQDGSVRGWLPQGAVSIARDGRIEPGVYQFSDVSGAGAHALAFDSRRRLFQSSDWGQSWVETLAPPPSAPFGNVYPAPRCSQVGCSIGPWLRVGWEVEVPAAPTLTQNVAPVPPMVKREALPILSCKQLAAPVIAEQTQAAADSANLLFGKNPASLAREQDYQATFPWATVHPIEGMGAPLGLSASFALQIAPGAEQVPLPANWPGYAAPARIFFVSTFDSTGRIQSASVSWRTLNAAARAAGLPSPSFEPGLSDDGLVVPVLGLDPGQTEGLLLDDVVPLWVRAARAPQALPVRLVADESKWISAVQRAPNQLALLSAGDDGSLEVFEFTDGRARRVFQMPDLDGALYPANPDALAIGNHGELAILRMPSGSEPATSADPALLFHEGGKVSVLAPWSELFLADAPQCKPSAGDYRALLQTRRAWLSLIDAGQPMTDEARRAGMFAIVRGNAERLCLEAVELADAPVEREDTSNETRLSARFVGRGRGAGRLGFGSGFEFRQALGCSLSGAR